MMHPGLPTAWALLVIAAMAIFGLWAMLRPLPGDRHPGVVNLAVIPILGPAMQRMVTHPWILLGLKLLLVGFFVTVIIAGLYGTPIAERNFATVLTWNLWWAGLVFSIFLLGSAWCAVCPWDAIAQWLVRRRLLGRAEPNNSLNLRLPGYLQNVWPALGLFVGLTWLELGVGITTDPYATALVALLMVVLATISLAVFKRKAFCRNFCPVGRTIGFYSQLAPVALRPVDLRLCADCKTLDCYHGNAAVEPCPTSLVMGTLKENTYCTSCGNCTRSCPEKNVGWQLRPPSVEAMQGARPRWDEAWFMIGLLALTAFHGITMMGFWEAWISDFGRIIGDSGRLLWSFSIGLLVSMGAIAGLYALAVLATRKLTGSRFSFRRSFSTMAFLSLPLAFSYHMAHNLNHLVRESAGLWDVLANPLGTGTLPLSSAERHQRHVEMWLSQDVLSALQAGLMIFGFAIAVQTIRYRGGSLLAGEPSRLLGLQLFPMLCFAVLMTSFHLWMLMQPMIMRM